MAKKYGISFSISRLIGIQTVKQKVAKKTGIPTTKLGFQRKIGAFLLSLLFGKK
jgi:hypothetical protein